LGEAVELPVGWKLNPWPSGTGVAAEVAAVVAVATTLLWPGAGKRVVPWKLTPE
jgi:hypothetical protein